MCRPSWVRCVSRPEWDFSGLMLVVRRVEGVRVRKTAQDKFTVT